MILLRTDGPVLLGTISAHRVRGGWAEYRNATNLPWHGFSEDGRWWAVTDLSAREGSEIYVRDTELLQAADGLDRVMTCIRRGPDGDMLVLDPATDETYFLAASRVSSDACEPGWLKRGQPIRVQWWQGEPVWVWGPS
jgi:hypothetical protein